MTPTLPLPLLDDPVGPAGFRVHPFLPPDALAAVRDLVAQVSPELRESFFASPADACGPEARAIDLALRAIVSEHVREIVPGNKIVVCGITAKGADGPAVPFHQDWTYTDERLGRATFLWCPLIDVEPENACLRVVPGSHRWSLGIRPSRRTDDGPRPAEPADAVQDELAELAVDVPLRAGEAAVFDPSALHGSWPNRTDVDRPAITIATVPDHLDLIHFHEHRDGTLEGFEVDDAFFTTNPYGYAPEGPPTVPAWTSAVQSEELVRASHAAGAAQVGARRPLLRDAEHQALLAWDGFTVLPFLTPDETADLLESYRTLSQPGDAGLTIDYMRPDRTLFLQFKAVLDALWAATLDRLVVDGTVAMTTFVTKHPSPLSDMFLHDDRSFVDEDLHRAITIWVPLVDVGPDLDNGGLQVVPRSHLLPVGLAGSATPDLIRPYEAHLRSLLEPVTAAAGSAVVYDTRLLHASKPNLSESWRVAAVCSVVPAEAQLAHVIATGRRTRELYAVEPTFYTDVHPHEAAERLPEVGRLLRRFDDERTLDPEDLGVLGGSGPALARPPLPPDVAADLLAEPGIVVLQQADVPDHADLKVSAAMLTGSPAPRAVEIVTASGTVAAAPLAQARTAATALGDLLGQMEAEGASGSDSDLIVIDPGGRARVSAVGPPDRLQLKVIECPAVGAGAIQGGAVSDLEIGTMLPPLSLPALLWNQGPGPLVILARRPDTGLRGWVRAIVRSRGRLQPPTTEGRR